jgi:hypothetical protein
MSRSIPFIVGLGILLGSELVHGHLTNRWRSSNELAASCAKLPHQDEPLIVGEWRGRPGAPLPEQELLIGQIAGYFSQVFTHPKGYAVNVLIVCGRPGPIAVHSPEVCLGGEGYTALGPKKRQSLSLPGMEKPVEFWVNQFYRNEGGLRKDRRQFWTYGAKSSWTADDNPRFTYAGAPALYKIYIMREMQRKEDKLEEDPTLEFIKVFMPELQRRLFPSASGS